MIKVDSHNFDTGSSTIKNRCKQTLLVLDNFVQSKMLLKIIIYTPFVTKGLMQHLILTAARMYLLQRIRLSLKLFTIINILSGELLYSSKELKTIRIAHSIIV